MKMDSPLQYAQLPTFQYQSFESHYQTFDGSTLKYSFYPVTAASSSDPLTTPKDQNNNNNPDAEPPAAAESAPETAPEEGPNDPPAEPSSPEAGGMSLSNSRTVPFISFHMLYWSIRC